MVESFVVKLSMQYQREKSHHQQLHNSLKIVIVSIIIQSKFYLSSGFIIVSLENLEPLTLTLKKIKTKSVRYVEQAP
uniref:Uncharacterized protein n=1 Tax=Glossina pallidipes TaxID=7398 RepID=A0A1B0A5D6_GLOPL